MFNGRVLGIIRYLKLHQTSTFRETAENLKVSEQNIRYDVDRINDILSLEKLPEIEKYSKGVLVSLEGLSSEKLEEEAEVIYTNKGRMSVLFLILLLRNEELKMSQLSRQFKVLRSAIKNDMDALDGEFRRDGLSTGYSDHSYLEGPRRKRTALLNQELKRCINYLINPLTNYNPYEFYCIHTIHMALEGISTPNVVLTASKLLGHLSYTLANTSYAWYMSNTMALIRFIIHRKEYPLDLRVVLELDREKFGEFPRKLEGVIGRPVAGEHVCLMTKLFNFTNRFAGINEKVGPVHTEVVTFSLTLMMSQEMRLPFDKDKMLVEGLLNHMIPLIQGVQDGTEIRDNMISLLGPEELKLYGLMKQMHGEVNTLKETTNEDEIVYLTVCFMASTRRMKSTSYRRVLLVYGCGYGTTTMLKEPLLSEYQIHIKGTVLLYKISSYPDRTGTDFMLSMTPFNNSSSEPCIMVNPIFQARDREAIEGLGVATKTILSSYYTIEERLMFLGEKMRMRVMEVIERELEYRMVRPVHNPKNFSSLLKLDCIALTDLTYSWQRAVEMSASLLLKCHFIERVYPDGMLDFIKKQRFYSVTDGSFALLHGKGNEGVEKTSLSLLANKQPAAFGDKKVKIIFCLASRNGREHISVVVTLIWMVKTTLLTQDLEWRRSEGETYQTISNCEPEVLQRRETVEREDEKTSVPFDWDAYLCQE